MWAAITIIVVAAIISATVIRIVKIVFADNKEHIVYKTEKEEYIN